MGGDYCCETRFENVFMQLDDETQIDKSHCDGGTISLESVCCRDNRFIVCPNNKKCKSSKGKIE